ncbi:hypothetical protein KVP40.0287 [Vibrio phage KVP40]|uniref:Uncharacterized protein n=4 Tax=Schizotequatrovirus KVP40 TaxID=1914019 RepID=Q6WHL6_BPKVM|nr:hypothetical protein KVP40.0287 [Vibrio phage KVP40]AFN37518.1 hypothetical protein pp2_285 [Vibrio phage phi-pp2]QHJ74466.1 hypothetical protein VH12019_00139 [Vibrio phage VH1_2019]QIW90139.1 hypothetical protein OLCHANIL_00042 [Vibrio phage V05]QIW91127.1 hypothetical protein COHAPHLL_00291 [Vibrio phage V09]UNA01801.1 hypothetical protein [Vibrio phage PC-Liy1]URQ03097.1 hypothetical protein PVA8_111 [Vibrio phage PVA8]WBM58833.1 hypothetical protein vBValMPVA8_111 [Vibrio phage vB_Va
MMNDVLAGIPMPPQKPKFIPESDDHQFFHDCAGFDWFYQFSDDHSVYLRGERELSKLKSRMTNERRNKIYEAWCQYMFSGPNFGLEQHPEPKWEDFKDA